jgi:hypothetical protein
MRLSIIPEHSPLRASSKARSKIVGRLMPAERRRAISAPRVGLLETPSGQQEANRMKRSKAIRVLVAAGISVPSEDD